MVPTTVGLLGTNLNGQLDMDLNCFERSSVEKFTTSKYLSIDVVVMFYGC